MAVTDALPVLEKYPTEVRQFRMDFSNKLRNESLTAVTSVSVAIVGTSQGGTAVTLTNVALDAPRHIKFTAQGGESGEQYKITATVTSTSNTLVGEGLLNIRSY